MTQKQQIKANELHVPVFFELAPSVYTLLVNNESISSDVQTTIALRLVKLMETLGIPGRPIVQIAEIDPAAQRASYWMRLVVHGKRCRYPHELLKRVQSYVNESMLIPEIQSGPILQWLVEQPLDDTRGRDKFVAFLCHACLEIVKKQPQVLLSLPQVEAYIVSLPSPANTSQQGTSPFTFDPARVHPILSAVLQLKISLTDRATVARLLYERHSETQGAISEVLIEALRSHIIEFHLSPGYLKQLTTTLSETDTTVFASLRTVLFKDIGLRFPNFRFVPDPDLPSNAIACRIHHVMLLPWKGLNLDQRLANMTSGYAKETYHLEGTSVGNPYLWWENYLFHAEANPELAAQSWSPLGYIELCLATDLKEHAFCFVHTRQVQRQLDKLENTFPALVKAVASKLLVWKITSLLRKLVMQGINIRNLPSILDCLLDYEFLNRNRTKSGIIDSMLAYYKNVLDQVWSRDPEFSISFVRMELKSVLDNTYVFSRGANVLRVYQFDPAVDELMLKRRIQDELQWKSLLLNEDEADRILDALHAQVAKLDLELVDYLPLILTQIYARPTLQELIAAELPRTAVLASQELLKDVALETVAVLSID